MRILAVDISNLFRRNWEATQGKEFSEAFNRTLQAIARFREGHARVAICCDGGKSFRKTISPSYKADRQHPGEPYYDQLRRVLERLEADGCTVFHPPSLGEGIYAEADDVIGSLCKWAREHGHSVSIVSADKDILQCLTPSSAEPNVCRIKPDDGAVQHAEQVAEGIGVTPAQIPEWLALAGDASDGYKPYKGLGDKSAVKLLHRYGSLPVIFKAPQDELAGVLENKPLAERMLQAGPEPAMLAFRLATLRCDLPLPFEALEAEPEVKELPSEAEEPAPAQSSADLVPAADHAPAAPAPRQSAALAAPQPVQGDDMVRLPYWAQPGYLDALWRVSKAFRQAGCFPNVGTPEQVMVVAMIAHEDGMGVATAMQHAYFVHGRLCWSATYLLMRAYSSGLVQVFDVVESTDRICRIKVQRRGGPVRDVAFKIDEAERGQLVKGGGNWQKWPVEMCLARAIARALRTYFRDLIGGRYVPEEMGSELAEDAVLEMARETRQLLADRGQSARAA